MTTRFGLGLAGLSVLVTVGCSEGGHRSAAASRIGKAHAAISDGFEVGIDEFPATAALRFDGITSGATCTGTLVAPQWVLTAAHCLKNVGTDDPKRWSVLLGASDINREKADEHAVIEVHSHPDWNAQTIRLGFGDVALLKLDKPVTNVTPVALHRTKPPAGSEMLLVGFGKAALKPVSEDQLSGILRAGENVTIACSSVPFDANRPEILDARSICFETSDSAGSCERDSGGPAYAMNDDGEGEGKPATPGASNPAAPGAAANRAVAGGAHAPAADAAADDAAGCSLGGPRTRSGSAAMPVALAIALAAARRRSRQGKQLQALRSS